MAVSDWALPAALVAGYLIFREARGAGKDIIDFLGDGFFDINIPDIIIQPKGVNELLQERTEALQEFELERVVAYQDIEQKRAAEAIASGAGNYGTIPSGLTGTWSREHGKAGNSCSLLLGTGYASNTTKYYTGKYCREAEALGLIDPFSG